MRFFHSRCGTLSLMASGAAEFSQGMGNDRVFAESDGANVCEARFLQPEMAGSATVGHLLLGKPNLLNARLEMTLKRNRVGATATSTTTSQRPGEYSRANNAHTRARPRQLPSAWRPFR